MNRTLIGVVALVLLLVGFAMLGAPRSNDNTAFNVAGGLMRIGFVLAALWLALPSIQGMLAKTPKWMLTAGVIGIIFCVVRPQLLLLVVPLLLVIWFLSGRLLRSPADPTILGRRQRRKRDDPKGNP